MKALYDYVVEVENRYNNKVDVEGKELIVNTEITERDHIFVNRKGKVVGTPTIGETEIEVGDEVLVHHNVFRRWYDMRGKEKNGRSFLFGNVYTVQPDQIFGYWRDGSFRGVPGYTYVSRDTRSGTWETQGSVEGIGEVVHSREFERGRLVGYKPGMDVEFDIDGKKLYRILNKFINVELEAKDKEAYRVF